MDDDLPPFSGADTGTEALMQQWKRLQNEQFRAAGQSSTGGALNMSRALETVVIRDVPIAKLEMTGHALDVVISLPEILVGAELVDTGVEVPDGDIVIAITPLYRRFLKELERDPNALYQLNPHQFEELIAGAYEEEGCDEVILTPQSRDGGRDVIATSKLFGTIRILEQLKLFKPNYIVEPNDVRAIYGVLMNDLRASKGIITTSSRFGKSVYEEFGRQIPSRIELRDGEQVRKRLQKLKQT
jgi:restriction system protein